MERCASLLFVLASLAPAQFVVQQRAGLRANLWFELTAKGDERATLTAPGTLPSEVGPAFARAAGCQPNDLQPEPYAARLNVRYPVGRSAAGGLHTQVRLSDPAVILPDLSTT